MDDPEVADAAGATQFLWQAGVQLRGDLLISLFQPVYGCCESLARFNLSQKHLQRFLSFYFNTISLWQTLSQKNRDDEGKSIDNFVKLLHKLVI